MGRTIIPVRYEVEAQLHELKRYLLSLRKDDKEAIDQVIASVKKHLSSISYANPLNPNELMQWSAILELEKKVEQLKHEIDRRLQG